MAHALRRGLPAASPTARRSHTSPPLPGLLPSPPPPLLLTTPGHAAQPHAPTRSVCTAAARRGGPSSPLPPPPGMGAGGPAGRAAPPPPPPPPPSPGHGLTGTLPFDEAAYVEVGRVTGAHGLRGELKLEVSTDEPAARFKAGSRLFLLPPSGQGLGARAAGDAAPLIAVTARGAKARPMGKGLDAWMVALAEVTGRTQAEQLYGYTLYCAAADRARLADPDEFYVQDLVGCAVADQASGRGLGVVVDVFSGMGTHDVLRVKLRATEADIAGSRIRYCLIPFVRAICPHVDLAARRLEVAPPEGLLSMATAEPLRRPLSDEVKAQKLAELREARRREEEALRERRAAQQEQQQAAPAAAAPAAAGRREDASSDEEDDEEGEEQEGEEAAAQAQRARRPGLRPQPGRLRLGRRRAAA